MTKRRRQFVVTHTATTQQTVVEGWEYETHAGHWSRSAQDISRKAGHYAPADSTVESVPFDQEYRLPFDSCPLIIRRAKP